MKYLKRFNEELKYSFPEDGVYENDPLFNSLIASNELENIYDDEYRFIKKYIKKLELNDRISVDTKSNIISFNNKNYTISKLGDSYYLINDGRVRFIVDGLESIIDVIIKKQKSHSNFSDFLNIIII